jgi:hypothetical protein
MEDAVEQVVEMTKLLAESDEYWEANAVCQRKAYEAYFNAGFTIDEAFELLKASQKSAK